MTDNHTCKSQSNGDIDLIVQNNPNLRPPDEIKIERIGASPYPDRHRVKVAVEVTPFREHPNLDITIIDAAGRTVANTSAIGLMNFTTTYVMHLRGMADPAGAYTVRAQLFYDAPDAVQDTRETELHIPVADAGQ